MATIDMDNPPEFKVKEALELLQADPIGNFKRKQEYLLSMIPENFALLVEVILFRREDEAIDNLLYYLFLWREEPAIAALLNSKHLSLEIIEGLLMFAYGRSLINDQSLELSLDKVIYFFSQDVLLDLLLYSKHIAKDRMFTIFLLTRLDIKHIDTYFSKADINAFVSSFVRMREATIRDVLYRNPALFGYFRQFAEINEGDEIMQDFMQKYEVEIKQIDAIKQIARKAAEIETQTSKNSLEHLKFLVRELQNADQLFDTIKLLDQEKVFTSAWEKNLVTELLSNPLFSETLNKLTAHQELEVQTSDMLGVDLFRRVNS